MLWLAGCVLLLVATGLGLRDPWPADEPRFALVARDMVATGQWLLPTVGGELYGDKPPLFFWLIGAGLGLTGSLRIAFLLPSLLAAVGCVLLTYDLARRLWDRQTGLLAALALLVTVQFVWQARHAQIDATLCFWTTLGLYGLLRHLLVGPAWRWYVIGWAAAGLGIITKGVGFLPLLVLPIYALLRAPGWTPRFTAPLTARWLLGIPALLLAVGVWLAPMLLAAMGNAEVAAYRDEILFQQTVTRYTDAWHHHEPVWYFIVHVIPALWLPFSAVLPWLVPHWLRAWRARDLRVVLPLCWVILVLIFFSLSAGKRGVYILPALPGLALAAAPFMKALLDRGSVQKLLFAIAALIPTVCALALLYLRIEPDEGHEFLTTYGFAPHLPLGGIALLTALACAWARPRRGALAYVATLGLTLAVVGLWVNPALNAQRSGLQFMAQVQQALPPQVELGMVAFKEQYLLHARRPVVHFGHARWREAHLEIADAAAWLNQSPGRALLVNEWAMQECFSEHQVHALGVANRDRWYLASAPAKAACADRGQAARAHHYFPPLSTDPVP